MAYLFLMIAIVAEVIATTFLKVSDGFTKLVPSIITVVGYSLAFFLLSLCLRTMPTGIAYAIWSGVGMILVTGIAWAYQGQRLDLAAIVGIGLILVGVVVMNLFSKSAPH